MAIDQCDVALNMCRRIVRDVNSILNALDDLEMLQEQAAASSIDLSSYVADIEADQNVKHCDDATYKNILVTFAPEIVARMKAFYSGTPTQQGWGALQKARSLNTGIPGML
jgi:hypothetical protein